MYHFQVKFAVEERKNIRKIRIALSPYIMGSPGNSPFPFRQAESSQGLSQNLSMLGYTRVIISIRNHIDINK
jgi:hypothetical protein